MQRGIAGELLQVMIEFLFEIGCTDIKPGNINWKDGSGRPYNFQFLGVDRRFFIIRDQVSIYSYSKDRQGIMVVERLTLEFADPNIFERIESWLRETSTSHVHYVPIEPRPLGFRSNAL